MDRTKTSQKQENILEKLSKVNIDKIPGLKKHDPLKSLTNEKKIAEAIFECLKNNDPEGVMEMIQTYIWALAKCKQHKPEDMPKSTFYHSLKHKNPTIKTLAKLVYSLTSQ